MVRWYRTVVSAMIIILLSGYMKFCVMAKEGNHDISPQDIVILLDASQSMKEVDNQYVSVDFIKGLAASLPSHYRMGMVIYQEEVINTVPLDSSYSMIEDAFDGLIYKQYGDAGTALREACTLLSEEENKRRILWITDGELLLSTQEQTQESVACYQQAIKEVQKQGITVDVLALGERRTEGETVYSAAEFSDGILQEFITGESLGEYLEEYLFSILGINVMQVGSLAGNDGELTIALPDTSMDKAKIILLGEDIRNNLTIGANAEQVELYQEPCFSTIDLLQPEASTVVVRTGSTEEKKENLKVFLFSEYSYLLEAKDSFYPESRKSIIELNLLNSKGESLFTPETIKSMEVLLNGEAKEYQLLQDKVIWEQSYEESAEVTIEVDFPVSGSYYYGDNTVMEEIFIPEMEEPQIDWLFWGILLFFLFANGVILYLAVKKRR